MTTALAYLVVAVSRLVEWLRRPRRELDLEVIATENHEPPVEVELCPHRCAHQPTVKERGESSIEGFKVECFECGCVGWLDARSTEDPWWWSRVEWRVP